MKRKLNISAAAVVIALSLMTSSCGTSSPIASTARRTYSAKPVSSLPSSKAKSAVLDFSLPSNLDLTSRMLLSEAKAWLGTPYLYGGESNDGVDCSGFVLQVYLKALNIKLPRNSAKQQQYCQPITRADLTPGDLVFFTVNGGSDVGHVGIYVGDDQMIHSSSSKGVIISSLSQKYYTDNFHSCGRISSFWAMRSGTTDTTPQPIIPRQATITTAAVKPGPATSKAIMENRKKTLDALLQQVEDSIYGQ